MDYSESEEVKEVSIHIQSKMFYEEGNLHLIPQLLRENPPTTKM